MNRVCQKLAVKFYGPYRVLEHIGATAYKLQLLPSAKIHPVFHISQLKLALDSHDQSDEVPPGSLTEAEEPVVPEDILEKRYDAKGELELLVKWKGRSSLENSWVLYLEFVTSFTDYQLKGKLDFVGGSIDRFRKVYIRKKLRGKEKVTEESEGNISNGEPVG